ncbi:hypothetical protein [Roseimarinus sediminis]
MDEIKNLTTRQMLKDFEIEYDARYVFKPVDIDYTVPDGTY